MTSSRDTVSIVWHFWCENMPRCGSRDIHRIPERTKRLQHEHRSAESYARSQALAHEAMTRVARPVVIPPSRAFAFAPGDILLLMEACKSVRRALETHTLEEDVGRMSGRSRTADSFLARA